MAENTSPSQDAHDAQSDSGQTREIRERAASLQKKVGELSKTFERIEQSLAEAAEDCADSNRRKAV